jgi:hydroxymethylpyrimidine pyrophosphatase-like HAD family hydrolase
MLTKNKPKIKKYDKILKFLKQELKDISGQFNFEINESSIIIVVKRINKGEAIKGLLSNENSLNKQKLAFGDSISDCSLMKISDLGTSVGKEKLEHADFHLPGNDRSVIKVLELN